MGCIVRADPDNFRENLLVVKVLDPLEARYQYSPGEELVANILSLQSDHEGEGLKVRRLTECVLVSYNDLIHSMTSFIY